MSARKVSGRRALLLVLIALTLTCAMVCFAQDGPSQDAIAQDSAATASDGGQRAPINPRFVEYIQSPLSTSSVFDTDVHGTGAVPSPLDINMLLIDPSAETKEMHAQAYPSKYDLRTIANKVPPIRNQGSCGSCWAFGAAGSLETTLRPAHWLHISENNIKNCNGFDWSCCGGGGNTLSSGYFVSWKGPIDTTDDPYTNDCTCHTGKTVQFHVQKIRTIPDKYADGAKSSIMNYGGVSTCVSVGGANGMNYSTGAHYETDDTRNHIVTIIGWDDNYPASNFLIRPPGNGAWLIRNSWGDWGPLHGYYWSSYYEPSVATAMMQLYGEANNNYNRIYQYDDLGWCTSYGYGSNVGWFANIFTAAASDQLAAVGWWTPSSWANYTIKVYRDPNSGPLNTAGPVYTQTGQLNYAGFDTVKLNTPVQLTSGHKFSVVVQLNAPNTNYPIPIQYRISGFSSRATNSAGRSYVSSNGSSWKDCTTLYNNGSVCLKAYTTVASSGGIVGTVTSSADSSPIPGALVSLSTGKSTVTDENGNYTFTSVTAGSYTVTASQEGFTDHSSSVTVVPLQNATCNIALAPITGGGTVAGTVTDLTDGGGIPGATIHLSNGLTATTDGDGAFTLSHAPAGTFTMSVSNGAYYGWNALITVVDNQVTTQNASLMPYPGIVVDNDTSGYTNGGSSWSLLTDNWGYYGSSYRWNNSNTGEHCKFTPNLFMSGAWSVFEWWPGTSASRAPAANTWVYYNGGSAYLTPDQRANGGRWNLLGTYGFNQGTGGYLEIGTSSNGSTVADAAAFVKADEEDGGGIGGTLTNKANGAPIEGASVTISGGRYTTTNSAGYYYVGDIPAGTVSVTIAKKGYYNYSNGSVTVYANRTTNLNVQFSQVVDIIIDNDTSGFTNGGSSWSTMTSNCCYYGSNYRFNNSNTGEHCVFTPNIPVAGNWSVYEWHPGSSSSRAPWANMWVYYSGGSTTTGINQQNNAGKWNLLGTWNFATGTGGRVEIGTSTGGSTVADAVKFVYAGGSGGDLTGTVTNASTHAVIPGAMVVIDGYRSTTTDSSGEYTFGGIPAGGYTVTVSAAGYATGTATTSVSNGGTSVCDVALNAQGGAVAGRVSDERGNSISGVSVSIPGYSAVTTDSNGRYTISGVASGTYTVTASKTGYNNGTGQATVSGNATTTCNIVLTVQLGSISGTVTSTLGGPVAGATVTVPCCVGTTDANGNYTLNNVPEGSYTVSVSAENYINGSVDNVAVTNGNNTVCNISLVPIAGEVSGQVTSGGNPVIGAVVAIGDAEASTDFNGNYTLNDIPAGTQTITVSKAIYYPYSSSVSVSANAVTTKDVSLTYVADIIIDNGGSGFSGGSTWSTLTSNCCYYGSNYKFQDVNNGDHCVFTPNIPVAGPWQVYEWWPGSSQSRAPGCPTWVYYNGGNVYMTPDQRSNAGKWNLLTTQNFATGTGGRLEIGTTGLGSTVADAAKFVYAPTNAGGDLSGTITAAEDGSPIAGATVTADGGLSTTTDADGHYWFVGVNPQSYTVNASAEGYADNSAQATVSYKGSTVCDIELSAPLGSISGVITSSLGGAVVGATVSIPGHDAVTTDSDGSYTIDGVAEGTYTVTASATYYTQNTGQAVVAAGNVTSCNIVLTPNVGTLTGHVTSSQGGAISGATVSIPGHTAVQTDANGSYTISNVAVGDYTVTASKTDFDNNTAPATITPGQSTTCDLELTPQPGTISGQVTSSLGGGVSGATVSAGDKTATTDGSGNYTLSVLPGTYEVTASADHFQNGSGSATVTSNHTTTVNLSMVPNKGKISGQITSSLGGGIGGATVSIPGYDAVTADAGGNYLIDCVLPGTYTVTASMTGYDSNTGSAVVTSDNTTTRNIVLTPQYGTISGTITSSLGGNLSGVTVSIPGKSTTTAANGTYTLSNVIPGNYTVSASLANYNNNSAPATVTQGQTTTVNMSLVPLPGSITGQITSGGNPVRGAVCSIPGYAAVSADYDGYYTISGVTPGTYTLTVSRYGYYASTNTGQVVSPNQATTKDVSLSFVSDIIINNEGSGYTNGGASWTLQTSNCCYYGSNYRLCTTNSGEHCKFTPTIPSGTGGNWRVYEWHCGSSDTRAPWANIWVYYNGGANNTLTGLNQRNNAGTWCYLGTWNFNSGTGNRMEIGTSTGGSTVADAAKFVYAPSGIGGELSGTVTYNGNPVAGATVSTNGSRQTTTDANGHYFWIDLPDGSYTVDVSANGGELTGSNTASVAIKTVATCNVTLAPPNGSISGTITSSLGGGLAGASVSIPGYSAVTTDGSGHYSIPNVAPSSYTVTASKTGYDNNTGSATVTPGNDTVCNITVTAQPGAISGKITSSVGGGALSSATVSIPGYGSVQTDGSGNYTISNVTAGTYTVTASKTNYNNNTAPNTVVNPGATTSNVNIALAPINGSITGQVTSGGSALAGATCSIPGYTAVTTDANGNYTISNVVPGTYSLSVTKSTHYGWSGNVTVNPNAATTQNVSLNAVADIIIDNDHSGFSGGTTWERLTSNCCYYGSNYLFNAGNDGNHAVFTPNIPVSGSWSVYEWHPGSSASRAPWANIWVYYAGGSTLTGTNQRNNAGTWVLLGTWNFNTGTGGRVEIGTSAGGSTVADAIKFVKQ